MARKKIITLRVTDREDELLRRGAAAADETRSDLLRDAGLAEAADRVLPRSVRGASDGDRVDRTAREEDAG